MVLPPPSRLQAALDCEPVRFALRGEGAPPSELFRASERRALAELPSDLHAGIACAIRAGRLFAGPPGLRPRQLFEAMARESAAQKTLELPRRGAPPRRAPELFEPGLVEVFSGGGGRLVILTGVCGGSIAAGGAWGEGDPEAWTPLLRELDGHLEGVDNASEALLELVWWPDSCP